MQLSSPDTAAILVVDDDPGNLDLLTQYLESHDLTVLVARDGESGLKRAQFACPDLVLMDVVMPGIDGFETCRRMKSSGTTREIPVIFMTSLADLDSKISGFNAGGVDYITKPFRQEEVLARVNAHLQIRSLTRKLSQANITLETRVSERTAELAAKNHQLAAEVAERVRTEDALRQAHDSLERRVAERTAELREANRQLQLQINESERIMAERDAIHKQLYETARRVGRAELAAIVLHNVGNAINSISISVELLQERIELIGKERLARVVGYLEEHLDDLPRFLLADDRGKNVIPYLRRLAERDHAHRAEQSQLVRTVRKSIGHITNILSQQNAYTGVLGGAEELVAPAELVDDALSIVAATVERSGVTIDRELADVGSIEVTRHKVVQILVNLLSNAVQAIRDAEGSNRVITIGVAEPDNEIVQFCVTDNGIGIAPENLNKLFRYGFTTRKDGHGIGLHGSSLTAQDLGGELTVTSPGLGQGATFTLTLRRDGGPVRVRHPNQHQHKRQTKHKTKTKHKHKHKHKHKTYPGDRKSARPQSPNGIGRDQEIPSRALLNPLAPAHHPLHPPSHTDDDP